MAAASGNTHKDSPATYAFGSEESCSGRLCAVAAVTVSEILPLSAQRGLKIDMTRKNSPHFTAQCYRLTKDMEFGNPVGEAFSIDAIIGGLKTLKLDPAGTGAVQQTLDTITGHLAPSLPRLFARCPG